MKTRLYESAKNKFFQVLGTLKAIINNWFTPFPQTTKFNYTWYDFFREMYCWYAASNCFIIFEAPFKRMQEWATKSHALPEIKKLEDHIFAELRHSVHGVTIGVAPWWQPLIVIIQEEKILFEEDFGTEDAQCCVKWFSYFFLIYRLILLHHLCEN